MFCESASCQPFEHAPNVNRIHDFFGREFTNYESTGIQLDQDSFLRQHGQGLANGSSRNSEATCQLYLPYALPGQELTMQNHLANSDDYS